ncbi:hypothetical protein C8R27_103123 [Nitrosomonas ureae]|nr:hypothetical protein C8R27_103123 [Nitrosomonas ureae]
MRVGINYDFLKDNQNYDASDEKKLWEEFYFLLESEMIMGSHSNIFHVVS